MLGVPHFEGIAYRFMKDLILLVEKDISQADYKIKLSYVEIYNETIKDLLSNNSHLGNNTFN
jgi:hypothetical protein